MGVLMRNGKVYTSGITGSSGSSELVELDDVNISSPSDGQALVYDNSTSKWVNGNGGVSTLAELSDTDIVEGYPDIVQQNYPTEVLVRSSSTGDWINAELYPLKKELYTRLELGDTSVSFTDNSIVDDAYHTYKVQFFATTTTPNMGYESITISSHTLTVNFDKAQGEDVVIRLEITIDSKNSMALAPIFHVDWGALAGSLYKIQVMRWISGSAFSPVIDDYIVTATDKQNHYVDFITSTDPLNPPYVQSGKYVVLAQDSNNTTIGDMGWTDISKRLQVNADNPTIYRMHIDPTVTS